MKIQTSDVMTVYLTIIMFSGYLQQVLFEQEVISAFLEVSFYVCMLLFTGAQIKERILIAVPILISTFIICELLSIGLIQ